MLQGAPDSATLATLDDPFCTGHCPAKFYQQTCKDKEQATS
ncbi:hypothetical protein T02_12336 [Trichinella nativa]|uniref:Uncharacterized protein n=1 Tax=Trichinella nativa TaxID=6335 RepID=A0A0V1LIU6_9BILA|nr:hypothetical protein T06_11917 [Trichinella sp. T6]KRZ59424.1 hypothetical protein T02_12336 [Trichinella nativa]